MPNNYYLKQNLSFLTAEAISIDYYFQISMTLNIL